MSLSRESQSTSRISPILVSVGRANHHILGQDIKTSQIHLWVLSCLCQSRSEILVCWWTAQWKCRPSTVSIEGHVPYLGVGPVSVQNGWRGSLPPPRQTGSEFCNRAIFIIREACGGSSEPSQIFWTLPGPPAKVQHVPFKACRAMIAVTPPGNASWSYSPLGETVSLSCSMVGCKPPFEEHWPIVMGKD